MPLRSEGERLIQVQSCSTQRLTSSVTAAISARCYALPCSCVMRQNSFACVCMSSSHQLLPCTQKRMLVLHLTCSGKKGSLQSGVIACCRVVCGRLRGRRPTCPLCGRQCKPASRQTWTAVTLRRCSASRRRCSSSCGRTSPTFSCAPTASAIHDLPLQLVTCNVAV